MRKILLVSGLGLVLVVGFIAMVPKLWMMPPMISEPSLDQFPQRLQQRLLLPDQELKEVSRVVTYADDNRTPVKADVEFVDGSTGYVNYRENGVTSTFGVYYPEKLGGNLKMEAEFGPDGQHYLWERHYSEAGTRVKIGTRLASGDYELKSYHEDGIQIASVAEYNPKGEVTSNLEYYDSGVMKKLVKVDPLKGTETTLFSEAGLKTSFHMKRGESIVWENYQDDGETPVIRFEQVEESGMHSTSYHVMATYYNPDGSLNHQRKFSRYYMYAIFKDADGQILYRQEWKHKQAEAKDVDSFAPDRWQLEAIHFGDFHEYSSPSLYLYPDGSVERYVYPGSENAGLANMTIKVFHPDGSLSEFRRPDPDDPTKNIETKYAPGESSERFDMTTFARYLEAVPYELPPQLPPEVKSHHR